MRHPPSTSRAPPVLVPLVRSSAPSMAIALRLCAVPHTPFALLFFALLRRTTTFALLTIFPPHRLHTAPLGGTAPTSTHVCVRCPPPTHTHHTALPSAAPSISLHGTAAPTHQPQRASRSPSGTARSNPTPRPCVSGRRPRGGAAAVGGGLWLRRTRRPRTNDKTPRRTSSRPGAAAAAEEAAEEAAAEAEAALGARRRQWTQWRRRVVAVVAAAVAVEAAAV